MTMAATLLFTLAKYLRDFCDRFAICLQRGEAEHIVTTIIKFEQLLSFIHWPTLLAAVLGKHFNATAETDVVIKSPHYLNGLDEVLEKSSESVVALYVGYTIFSWFAPLIVNLDASTNTILSPSTEQNRQWAKFQCLLLSEGVFGFAYLHAFSSLPAFDSAQRAAFESSLEASGYSMLNFRLHPNFLADSKQVFYAAHMTALCDETDTAQNSFIYRMFNEDLFDFFRGENLKGKGYLYRISLNGSPLQNLDQ
ncbi:hypothetical protein V5799_031155 [Amblyomma americanum]|uniref:Peptidase M13 N-terminal domain-containing protein n=1 Tax=Amblyomma americanum TaxID=6943 RepID=A0AAQ4ELD0_AMBAM